MEDIKENDLQKEEKKEKSLIETAQEIRDEIRAERQKLEQERQKLEETKATSILSGRSDAGEQPEPPKLESPKEYKDRIMRGEI